MERIELEVREVAGVLALFARPKQKIDEEGAEIPSNVQVISGGQVPMELVVGERYSTRSLVWGEGNGWLVAGKMNRVYWQDEPKILNDER